MSIDGSNEKKNPPANCTTYSSYIPPGDESLIVLKTLPNSTCYLHLADDSTADYILKLYADQDGIIRFHVRPDNEAEAIARLVVKCESENKSVQYPLELRLASNPQMRCHFQTMRLLNHPRKTLILGQPFRRKKC